MANQVVDTHQRPNTRGYHAQWGSEDLIERKKHEPYDTTGDMMKKVIMEVLDFEGWFCEASTKLITTLDRALCYLLCLY